jgi:hypothetical protein
VTGVIVIGAEATKVSTTRVERTVVAPYNTPEGEKAIASMPSIPPNVPITAVGRRGRYRAAGIGGDITGKPADILIIDDPIKDFAEAMSDTIREGVWNWLTSTAMTRLQEGGGVIIIATRWHMDDPIGRLLERRPGRWNLINFRAIAEEDEPPHRLAGEPLSAERFGLDLSVANSCSCGGWRLV